MAVQPIDIVLFLVSFAACFYCFVLSRRLRALHDTKEGIGATIVALSKSISTVSSTAQNTKEHTGELILRLTNLMAEAQSTCERLEKLTRAMQDSEKSLHEAQKSATVRTQSAQADIAELIEDLETRSQKRVKEVTSLMRAQIVEAQTELSETMKGLLDTSKDRIIEMSTVIKKLETLLEAAKTMGRDLDKAGLSEARPIFKAV